MSGACLATRALTGLFVEDMVHRAGRSRGHVANTLASVVVEVSVRATVMCLIPLLTHTLTSLHVQFLISATHICGGHVCRGGEENTDRVINEQSKKVNQKLRLQQTTPAGSSIRLMSNLTCSGHQKLPSPSARHTEIHLLHLGTSSTFVPPPT